MFRKEEIMHEIIRPVRFGILIGLIGLIFGIGWAFWLVLGHERIHQILEKNAKAGMEEHGFIQLLEPAYAQAHTHEKPQQKETGHMHEDERDMTGTYQHGTEKEGKPHIEGGHDSPIMKLSHIRLTRGHIHAMGLGLFTIVISLVIAFTSASENIKVIASVLAGIGGIIYPFAWIIMGYRTPAMGPDAAELSVMPIAGVGVALILLGILTAIIFLLRDIFSINITASQQNDA